MQSELLSLLGALFLVAAVQGPVRSLEYDSAVFIAGDCLSPGLAGCNAAGRGASSASQALLSLDREPQLALDFSGLIDQGPELTGGRGPDQVASR